MKKTIIFLTLVIASCTVHEKEKNGLSIYLNQSGFDTEWPKRFTTSSVKENTPFKVIDAQTRKKYYQGKIRGNIGDFSDFHPSRNDIDYVIQVKKSESDMFNISPFLFYETSFKPALEFMIDARSVIGTHNSSYGGCPWRDGTYYSFEMPSLVMLYLSNPDYFGKLKPEIDYASDKKKVLNPDFKITDEPHDDDALDTTRRYYTELDPPVGTNIPDIIQLIHWGTGWYLIEPDSHDPSGDPKGNIVHDQTIEQLAFFLYGFPAYQQYFTRKFYNQVLNLTLEYWEKAKLFDVKTEIGNFKGRETPGHSILPNLLMSEIAKRENFSATPYVNAAVNQAQWIIDSLDLSDPKNTKGQRMSEYKLYTGLTTFFLHFPKIAPKGLKSYLNKYAEIVVQRANNKWDFRKYSDSLWSIPRHGAGLPKTHPGWNEPGNLASFPALAFDLAKIVDNPHHRKRLKVLAVAQWDNLFGRNPVSAHAANRGEKDYKGVERGWPKHYKDDVCARMEKIRGALSSSASTEHYINGVSGDFRWPEGWVNFNAAFNVGLAYASVHDIHFSFKNKIGEKISNVKFDQEFIINLKVLTPHETKKIDDVFVDVYKDSVKMHTIKLVKSTLANHLYQASITLTRDNSNAPNIIQVSNGNSVSFVYGFGVFGKENTINIAQ